MVMLDKDTVKKLVALTIALLFCHCQKKPRPRFFCKLFLIIMDFGHCFAEETFIRAGINYLTITLYTYFTSKRENCKER